PMAAGYAPRTADATVLHRGGAGASGRVPRRRRCPYRRGGCSTVHRAGVPRVPRLRRVQPWLRARALRRLRLRAAGALLLQRALLPELRRAAHGGAGGAPRRSGAPARARPAVGSERAAPAALPPRLRSRALPSGAERVHPRASRLLPTPRTAG